MLYQKCKARGNNVYIKCAKGIYFEGIALHLLSSKNVKYTAKRCNFAAICVTG